MAYLLAAGFLALIAVGVVLISNGAVWLGLRRGWRPLACVGVGTVVLLALLAGGLFLAGIDAGHGLAQAWRREFERSLTTSLALYRQLGWEEAELQRTARLVRMLFVDAAFGWLVILAAGLAFLGYLIQRRIAPQLPGSRIALRPFSAWVIPEHLIWFLLGALGLLLLGPYLPAWGPAVAWNTLVVLSNIYFLGGAVVAVFMLEKRHVPRAFQILFLLAVGLLPMLVGLLIVLGVFDTWWDWRRIKTVR